MVIMKISKVFLVALLLLLCAGSVIAYGYWLNREIPEVNEADLEYENFLKAEYERLEDTDPKDLTATEKELVKNMGDDWESLETAAVELINQRHKASNKLAAESVGEYDWQHEPDGVNGWKHLAKANEEISKEIAFRVTNDFWGGSKPATEAERKELLDSWERAEPHLKLAEQADFLRSPEDEYSGFNEMGFYSVQKRAIICDFIELNSDSAKKIPRLELVQGIQSKDLTPPNLIAPMIDGVLATILSQAVRGGLKQGLITPTQLTELEKLFTTTPTIIESWHGEFWTSSRLESSITKDTLRCLIRHSDGIGDLVDSCTINNSFGSRENQGAAVSWLKDNPGDLTDAKYAARFTAQKFANDKIIDTFNRFLASITEARIAKASIHLYFDKGGQPPANLPEIPMTVCRIEGKEIVFYWDLTHPMASEHNHNFPEIRRLK